MKKQFGMGMIEILVALLISAVGLIGITGMQAVSLKNNLSALNRSNALFLAGTMMDRIRTNPSADYETTLAGPPPISPTACSAASSNCTPAQIAQVHLADWKCRLGGYQDHIFCADIDPIMPDALGSIALNAQGNYDIDISWVDRVSYVNGSKTGGQPVTIQATLGM